MATAIFTSFGSNTLLHNNGDGTFTDTTDSAGTDDSRWSVPATFIDFDGDGWLDLYVGNFVEFRMATHKKCSSSSGASDYCAPIVYEPESDRLFRNRGDGSFEDVSRSAAIDREYGGALGVVGADFNGDGWLDFYVANDGMANQLWINQGDGTFVNDAVLGGAAVNEQGLPEASMGV
ncbi:MAG: VCBS repeat-containing protein, partial [Acidobacteriota bacterium]